MSGKRKGKPVKVAEAKRAALSYTVSVVNHFNGNGGRVQTGGRSSSHGGSFAYSFDNFHSRVGNYDGRNVVSSSSHRAPSNSSWGSHAPFAGPSTCTLSSASQLNNSVLNRTPHISYVISVNDQTDSNSSKSSSDGTTGPSTASIPKPTILHQPDRQYYSVPVYSSVAPSSFGILGHFNAFLATNADRHTFNLIVDKKDSYSWTIMIQKCESDSNDVSSKTAILKVVPIFDTPTHKTKKKSKVPKTVKEPDGYSFLCTVDERYEHIDALCCLSEKKMIYIVLSVKEEKGEPQFTVYLDDKAVTSLNTATEEKGGNMVSQDMKTAMYYFYNTHETVNAWSGENFVFDSDQGVNALFEHVKNIHLKEKGLELNKHVLQTVDMSHPSMLIEKDEFSDSGISMELDTSDTSPENSFYEDTITDIYQYEHGQNNDDEKVPPKTDEQIIIKRMQHAALNPELRKYQDDAVTWMINREKLVEYERGEGSLHILWTPLETLDGKKFMYNKYNGRLTESVFKESPLPSGGILADEMGLGKSVEVLACILNNPCPDKYVFDGKIKSGSFSKDTAMLQCGIECCICGSELVAKKFSSTQSLQCHSCNCQMHAECSGYGRFSVKEPECPSCSVKESINSHCTLIISPETIANQWEDEIEKHIKDESLKCMIYKGVAKQGYVQPKLLATYDVIITTYATLRADFYHVTSEESRASSSRSLRHKKRYAALPSPLMAVNFWRVCLDEAQMVECPTSRTAEMAAKIRAQNRWCVTGTPVNKGLEDIYGLLVFLGLYPYCQRTWWKKLLYDPYVAGHSDPMFRLFGKILWRTIKKDVVDQINIPEQTETTQFLRFSPVEHHFYQRQREECTEHAVKELRKWTENDLKLSTLDRHTLYQLLAPLLKLRQACCHPGVVRGSSNLTARGTLTMDKLLHVMTDKAKSECEEAHRQLLCALNGLAALHIIEKKWPEAVECYREAIRSWVEHADIKTDSLQKLHTVYNLDLVLADKHEGCSHSLQDDKLRDQAADIKSSYLEKASTRIDLAEKEYAIVAESIELVKSKIHWTSPWWTEVINILINRGVDVEFGTVNRIKEELTHDSRASHGSIKSQFTDLSGLRYLLYTKSTALQNIRKQLLASLEKIKKHPSKDDVHRSAECCLRPADGVEVPRCRLCVVDDVFSDYETTLFAHQGMNLTKQRDTETSDSDDIKRYGGLRADTELDKVFKVLHAISKQKKLDERIVQEGKEYLTFIELLKKEFKALREIWFALHQQVASLDEIEMCTSRLRLRLPGEQRNLAQNVIDDVEIAPTRYTLMADKATSEKDLQTRKGRLTYLYNLAKAEDSSDGFNPEKCPICTGSLGFEWGVFSCCHCYCCDCVYLLQTQHISPTKLRLNRNVNIKCPLCRVATPSNDIAFVTCGKKQTLNDDLNIEIKGNHSTKVEGVVKKVLSIAEADPEAKILIFSTWIDVLHEIEKALVENAISSKLACGSGKQFQVPLARFKQEDSIKVLLLPLQSGSKGLNIIEATHVILVEPILNQANELQAIGRVHRIGQTKPTFVHRFIVKGTVEERMQKHLERKTSLPSTRNSEDCSMTIGDLSSLFQYDSD